MHCDLTILPELPAPCSFGCFHAGIGGFAAGFGARLGACLRPLTRGPDRALADRVLWLRYRCSHRFGRIRLAAYGARLERVLGSRPRGFKSLILRGGPKARARCAGFGAFSLFAGASLLCLLMYCRCTGGCRCRCARVLVPGSGRCPERELAFARFLRVRAVHSCAQTVRVLDHGFDIRTPPSRFSPLQGYPCTVWSLSSIVWSKSVENSRRFLAVSATVSLR